MCCHKYSVVCTRTLAQQQQQPFGVDFWRPDLPESSSCWLQRCVSPSSARFTYAFSFFLSLSLLPRATFLKKLEKTATGGAHKFHFAGNWGHLSEPLKGAGAVVINGCECVCLLVCARQRGKWFILIFLFCFSLFYFLYHIYIYFYKLHIEIRPLIFLMVVSLKKKKVNILRLWSEVPPSLHPLCLLLALSAPSGTKQEAHEKTQAMTGEE